eukprot:TRINITY_DN208_c0_g1_i5.p1 TRINITY_DN208_c0_g1~~TRINITY_DN208_c0_g1_i5.p1  ORF type:complete len:1082 (+),score=296.24 TRINITY_DN208_c0_g1_i5:415-3246(+)
MLASKPSVPTLEQIQTCLWHASTITNIGTSLSHYLPRGSSQSKDVPKDERGSNQIRLNTLLTIHNNRIVLNGSSTANKNLGNDKMKQGTLETDFLDSLPANHHMYPREKQAAGKQYIDNVKLMLAGRTKQILLECLRNILILYGVNCEDKDELAAIMNDTLHWNVDLFDQKDDDNNLAANVPPVNSVKPPSFPPAVSDTLKNVIGAIWPTTNGDGEIQQVEPNEDELHMLLIVVVALQRLAKTRDTVWKTSPFKHKNHGNVAIWGQMTLQPILAQHIIRRLACVVLDQSHDQWKSYKSILIECVLLSDSNSEEQQKQELKAVKELPRPVHGDNLIGKLQNAMLRYLQTLNEDSQDLLFSTSTIRAAKLRSQFLVGHAPFITPNIRDSNFDVVPVLEYACFDLFGENSCISVTQAPNLHRSITLDASGKVSALLHHPVDPLNVRHTYGRAYKEDDDEERHCHIDWVIQPTWARSRYVLLSFLEERRNKLQKKDSNRWIHYTTKVLNQMELLFAGVDENDNECPIRGELGEDFDVYGIIRRKLNEAQTRIETRDEESASSSSSGDGDDDDDDGSHEPVLLFEKLQSAGFFCKFDSSNIQIHRARLPRGNIRSENLLSYIPSEVHRLIEHFAFDPNKFEHFLGLLDLTSTSMDHLEQTDGGHFVPVQQSGNQEATTETADASLLRLGELYKFFVPTEKSLHHKFGIRDYHLQLADRIHEIKNRWNPEIEGLPSDATIRNVLWAEETQEDIDMALFVAERMRCEIDSLIGLMKRTAASRGKRAIVVAFGNAKVPTNIPTKWLMERMSKEFIVVKTSEFNTSKLCSCCGQELRKHDRGNKLRLWKCISCRFSARDPSVVLSDGRVIHKDTSACIAIGLKVVSALIGVKNFFHSTLFSDRWKSLREGVMQPNVQVQPQQMSPTRGKGRLDRRPKDVYEVGSDTSTMQVE